jgi:hypothetical protein
MVKHDNAPASVARGPAAEALNGATQAGATAPRGRDSRIDHSPRLLAQRQAVQALMQAPAMAAQRAQLGAMFGRHVPWSPAGEPVLQRKIAVAGRTFGMQDENLHELKFAIDREMGAIEADLRPSGVSVDQVLTRFDFQNRRFADMASLIKAVRQELKQDLGADDPQIDRLLPVHPLEHDRPGLSSPQLDQLLARDSTGNLRNLVLEDTDAARQVMEDFRNASKHPQSDTVLFKSILATLELHQAGATLRGERSDEERQLLAYVEDAYDEDTVADMLDDYGITEEEHRAVVAYSYPNKDKLFVGGRWNVHYMGSSRGNWRAHGDGWKALGAALKKLPSLGQLQLELTTYRLSRNSDESDALAQLPLDTQILHGKHVLSQGQKHVTSTSLTYNYFNNPDRVQKAKGVMAIHGSSGVLINPFGGQGFIDGAEVLYPPSLITALRSRLAGAYQRPGFSAPVYHLHEVPRDPQHALVDDFRFEQVADQYTEIDKRQGEMLTALIDEIQRFNALLTGGGQHVIPPDEMSVQALGALKQKLLDQIETFQHEPWMIENYNKLILIDQLNALEPLKRIELKILLLRESPWAQSCQRLQGLLNQLS